MQGEKPAGREETLKAALVSESRQGEKRGKRDQVTRVLKADKLDTDAGGSTRERKLNKNKFRGKRQLR